MSDGYVRLGHRTKDLRLETVRGSAMPPTSLRRRDGEDWPGGTTASFVFGGGTVWAATVDGPRLVWTATQAQVDAQPNGTELRLVIDGVVYLIGEVAQRG